jgi:hypothetical protein
MDWATVKTTTSAFVHRKDIPWDVLQPLALDDINLALEVQENEAVSDVALAAVEGNGFMSSGVLPAGYVAMRGVMIGSTEYNPRSIKDLFSRGDGRRWYAVSGQVLFVTTAGGTPANIVYSARIPTFAADGDSSWLSDRYSNVLVQGLLKQAAIYIEDDELQAGYENQFLSAINTANAKYIDAAYGAGTAAVVPGGGI